MKGIVITACSLLWLTVSVVRLPDIPRRNEDIGIDASWVLALPEMLHQHSVSGRDFHFTYGPLSQVVAYAGASLHSPWSGISSLPLIILAFDAASVVLIGLILFLMEGFGWKECIFVYAASAGLNLFSEPTAFRPLALMLGAVLLSRALQSRILSRKLVWSAAAGAACYAGQLLTFEIGLYGILMALITGLVWPVGRRQSLACIGVFLAVFLAGNLAIDCYFALSSPNYGFIDYQRYGLETIRGYGFSQSVAWELTHGATACLGIVSLFAVFAALLIIFKWNRFFLPLLICSLISLKSVTVRSDTGHITQSAGPLVFLLLAAGAIFAMNWRSFKVPVVLWAAAFVTLWLNWPWAGSYTAKDMYQAATRTPPLGKLARLRTDVVGPAKILPEGLATQGAFSTRPLLALPYETYIPVALQRPIKAPVLTLYSASTEPLQQYYIRSLERESNLDVIYGVDGLASTAIDGIQFITRAPMVFEYLYRNFRLGSIERFGKGFYLLQRDGVLRRESQSTKVITEVRQIDKRTWEVKLNEPRTCSLLKLDIGIRYPFGQYIGHPAPLELLFTNKGLPFLKTGLMAIKPDAPFSTLISLMPDDHFFEVFGSERATGRSWDRILISPRAADPLGVPPSKIDIRSIACVL